MLVEFSVTNYRSILEKQKFSMVAGSSREIRGKYSAASGHKSVPNALKAAAIFGPNASGKSTLVMAISFMCDFVISSAKESQEGELVNVTPFKFTRASRDNPSEFEIVFIHDGSRYQYGFSVDEIRVYDEWLFVIPSGGRSQRWFERVYNRDNQSYEWYVNPSLKGEKEIWKKSTRDNALFLSSAVQLRAEPLKAVLSWFQQKLRIIESSERPSPAYTASDCKSEEKKKKILNFLNFADINIVDISVKEKEFSEDMLPPSTPADIKESLKKRLANEKFISFSAGHQGEDGEIVYLDFNEESDGTQVLFSLAGPWLDVLEKGRVLIVDELSNSLHPLALQYLIELFYDPTVNTGNAQLVFTSHDTSIMSGRLLHPDQIWLIEKNQKQATQLTPLSDFKVRQHEAIQKGYLGGRYGALPNIGEWAV